MTSKSIRQVRMLRHMADRPLTREQVRSANQITLWSLLQGAEPLATRTADGGAQLTKKGYEVASLYGGREFVKRKREADISERVARLLQASRIRRVA